MRRSVGGEGDLVQDTQQQSGDDEGEMHHHIPEQLVIGYLLGIHKGAQEMDGGNGDDGGGHLELQGAGVQLAEPMKLFRLLPKTGG